MSTLDTFLSQVYADMSNKTLDELVSRAGITKAELARRLGLQPNTVSKWGSTAPRYAVAYLELLIEHNRVRP